MAYKSRPVHGLTQCCWPKKCEQYYMILYYIIMSSRFEDTVCPFSFFNKHHWTSPKNIELLEMKAWYLYIDAQCTYFFNDIL